MAMTREQAEKWIESKAAIFVARHDEIINLIQHGRREQATKLIRDILKTDDPTVLALIEEKMKGTT